MRLLHIILVVATLTTSLQVKACSSQEQLCANLAWAIEIDNDPKSAYMNTLKGFELMSESDGEYCFTKFNSLSVYEKGEVIGEVASLCLDAYSTNKIVEAIKQVMKPE